MLCLLYKYFSKVYYFYINISKNLNKKEIKMELHIGNFYVKDIKFGDRTKFENSTLTINKE